MEEICASAQFKKAPAQRDLLRYLWQHRHELISEYTIGTEALGRKHDFDPKFDSTVRVQISRLRQRLKDYYESEGLGLSKRVQIPPGGYRPEIVEAAMAEPVAEPAAKPSWNRWLVYGLAGLAVLLAADDLRLRQAAVGVPALADFWARVAQPGQPTPIIVPAPIFFRWEGQPYVVRDFGVNRSSEFPASPFLAPLGKQFGPAQMTQLYTVASDTRAASTLAKYLQDRAVPADILDTPAASLDVFGAKTTIVFAGPGTTSQLGSLLEKMNFYVLPIRGGVLSRNPGPGEPAHYAEIRHAPLRSTNYGVIARVPGRAAGSTALVFLSTYNPALLSVCLNPAELESFEARLRQAGNPTYFEAVIEFERNADRVLRAQMVALRSISN